jgi:hypothetical protein
MEKSEKREKRKKIIGKIFVLITISTLLGLYLNEKSKVSKLEGVIENMEKTVKGLVKTLLSQAYALGRKKTIEHYEHEYGK